MPVLSIIACGMLEDELAHVLCKDKELSHLALVDAAGAYGLARKLRAQNRPFLTADLDQIVNLLKDYRDATAFSNAPTIRERILGALRGLSQATSTGYAVVANVLKIDLHGDVELLKTEVYRNIECMANFSDGILVLYGLCDSLRDLECDFAGHRSPLYFLADERGERVEDCVALALGGNRLRWRISDEYPNILFFFTPMWASNWQNDADKFLNDGNVTQGTARLIKHALSRKRMKVAQVDTGLRYECNFGENVRDFAQRLKLDVIQLKGDTDIVDRCYRHAKTSVRKRASTLSVANCSSQKTAVGS